MRIRARDVPFAAGTVDGWRAWSVVERDGDLWLSSLTRPQDWLPAEAFEATCTRRRHAPPRRGCSCGVYAAAEPEELAGLGRIAGAAVGQVSLWGRVAEHSRGYRAATAYPARLRLVCVGCLAEGDGVPAAVVDRDAAPGRTRLVPLCREHASGRPLPAAADVERRLLAKYQVDAVPDGSIARIKRDPRVEDAERRSRRRVLAVVAVTLSVLAAAAAAGELARDRAEAPIALASSGSVPEEIVKISNDLTSDGQPVQPAAPVLRYSPRASVSDSCGRLNGTEVVAANCDDPRADVSMANISSVGARHGAEVCDDATVAVTRLGDRVTCWHAM